MKRKFVLNLFAFAALLFLGVSCSNDDDITPEQGAYADYSCLIVNQGNYREKNSSISYYRESDKKVVNTAFYKANGRYLSAFVESAATNGTLTLIICNDPDKIEVIDVKTAQTVCEPIKGNGIVSPRYAVMNQQYAYVTCWGERVQDGWWDEDNPRYIFPNSCVVKIDLTTKQVVKKIACRSSAEGILWGGDKLYIAVDGGVDVFNTTNDTKISSLSHKTFYGSASHLGEDKNGKIWYSAYGQGYGIINPATMTVEQEVQAPATQGYFTMNKAKDKVLFFTNDTDANWKVTASAVYSINVDSKTVSTQPVYAGTHINGVGANPATGNVYTAEIYGYGANSTLKTFNEQGAVKDDETTVGVGASRFVFY